MRRSSSLQALAPLRVERAEGLVHEQDVGAGGERAGDRDALPHAARDAVGIGVGEVGEADEREIMSRRARCFSAAVRSSR